MVSLQLNLLSQAAQPDVYTAHTICWRALYCRSESIRIFDVAATALIIQERYLDRVVYTEDEISVRTLLQAALDWCPHLLPDQLFVEVVRVRVRVRCDEPWYINKEHSGTVPATELALLHCL